MAVSPLLVPVGGSPSCCAAGGVVIAPPRLDQHPCLGNGDAGDLVLTLRKRITRLESVIPYLTLK